jgi:hypothetical protein
MPHDEWENGTLATHHLRLVIDLSRLRNMIQVGSRSTNLLDRPIAFRQCSKNCSLFIETLIVSKNLFYQVPGGSFFVCFWGQIAYPLLN